MLDIAKSFGKKLQKIRKSKRITQEQLAEKLDLDVGYISKLEVGRNFPTIGTLEKIANALDVELYELFRYTNIKSEDFKDELIKIYDNRSKDKQLTLYRVAKAME